MSIFRYNIPFRRAFSRYTTHYCPHRCPEDTHAFSTTFKVNLCVLFCTSMICRNIRHAVEVLKDKDENQLQKNDDVNTKK